MLIVRGTRKFLQRVPGARLDTNEPDTAALREWYATVLFWRPHLALFVNEATLLPVLVPLAPVVTLLARFPQQLAETLAGYQLDPSFIDDQTATMYDARLATSRNRSVVGSMNEFTHLLSYADRPANHHDLSELAQWLAQTPCGPLHTRHGTPEAELRALAHEHNP